MANGFKIDLRLDLGKEVKCMDSCDGAGRSMICGGSKKILAWYGCMDSCDGAGRSMICGGSKKILAWLDMDFIFDRV